MNADKRLFVGSICARDILHFFLFKSLVCCRCLTASMEAENKVEFAPNTSDSLRCHDKRKVEQDDAEEFIQPKRMCQPVEGPKKFGILRRKSDGLKRLDTKKGTSRRSYSSSPPGLDYNQLDNTLKALVPEDIENLRLNLEDGHLDRHYNWMFWNTLNSTYGSALGYLFGFIVIILKNRWWIMDELVADGEGHTVSKTLVVLFFIYGYSYITLGLEAVQFVFLTAKLYFPSFCAQLTEEWREHNEFLRSFGILNRFRSSKYFYTPFVALWCAFSAFVGSEVWIWFWWNHICKTYHDRTCRQSWLGQYVMAYRDQSCYDGTASSAICEKFVSYFPIMLFAVVFVFLGNVLLPLINDWLSLYYPISPKLEAAFDILRNMNKTAYDKVEEPLAHDFTFTKTFQFDDDVDVSKSNLSFVENSTTLTSANSTVVEESLQSSLTDGNDVGNAQKPKMEENGEF